MGSCRLLFVLIALETSMGDPRTEVAGQCCNSSIAVSGEYLAANFVPAMGNLSSLVEEKGFGTAVAGKGSDAVFGLAQCFKNLNSIDCRLCFSEIRSLLPKCYPKTGGKIFLHGSFGRYENYSCFSEATGSDDSRVCSPTNRSSESIKFGEVMRDVVGNLSSEAQRKNGFAVGSASISGLTVDDLAQCWEILDTGLCNLCLNKAASSLMLCIPGPKEGHLMLGII